MGLIPAVRNTAKTFRKRIRNDKKTLGLCMAVVGESGGGGVRVGGKGFERVLRELSGCQRALRGLSRGLSVSCREGAERALGELSRGPSASGLWRRVPQGGQKGSSKPVERAVRGLSKGLSERAPPKGCREDSRRAVERLSESGRIGKGCRRL